MYNPNIPNATDFLSDSQGQMKTNFQQLNSVYDVDHSPYTSATNIGYHKDVHVVKRTGNPTNVTDVQIVFSKDYTPDSTGATADTQLFTLTANNVLSQLSGKLLGANYGATSDGWCWVGGILLQWGYKALATSSGTITFKDRTTGAIPFPNKCLSVFTTTGTGGSTSSSNGTVSVKGNATSTSFDWFFVGTGTYTYFNWLAIGY